MNRTFTFRVLLVLLCVAPAVVPAPVQASGLFGGWKQVRPSGAGQSFFLELDTSPFGMASNFYFLVDPASGNTSADLPLGVDFRPYFISSGASGKFAKHEDKKELVMRHIDPDGRVTNIAWQRKKEQDGRQGGNVWSGVLVARMRSDALVRGLHVLKVDSPHHRDPLQIRINRIDASFEEWLAGITGRPFREGAVHPNEVGLGNGPRVDRRDRRDYNSGDVPSEPPPAVDPSSVPLNRRRDNFDPEEFERQQRQRNDPPRQPREDDFQPADPAPPAAGKTSLPQQVQVDVDEKDRSELAQYPLSVQLVGTGGHTEVVNLASGQAVVRMPKGPVGINVAAKSKPFWGYRTRALPDGSLLVTWYRKR